ncbi:MAG: radical SAM protein [Candidatus Pacearchaeota archaeon]
MVHKQKIFIKTYGCQANINDSEIMAALFSRKYQIADSENSADIIFINSCAVKNKTQSKILDYIKKHKDKKIIVGGCLVKTLDIKKQFPKVKTIDTINLQRLGKELIRNKKNIAIIQISQGCMNNCTYCATRLAKGKLKSYPIKKIKLELKKAVDEEIKTIYITSQDNGCYGKDTETNLVELLRELIKVERDYKIRIGMSNPQYVVKYLDELLSVMENKKIIKFLHIPVQSGSNKVLKDMKRGHSSEDFVIIVNKFRKKFPRQKFPDSTIATDIIVGYPTETEDDFQKTLNLIKNTKPEVLNISAFSSRAGTPASRLKQLSSEIIKQRTKKLNDIYREYRKELKGS